MSWWIIVLLPCVLASPIFFKSGTIDTVTTPEFMKDAEFQYHRSDSTDNIHLFLVHVIDPASCSVLGSRHHWTQYIPENTWIVRSTPLEMTTLRQNEPLIDWIGYYRPRYKTAKHTAARDVAAITVFVDEGIARNSASQRHRDMEWKFNSTKIKPHGKQKQIMETMARDPDVIFVDALGSLKHTVLHARTVLYGASTPSFTGASQIIGIADTGMDIAHEAYGGGSAIESYFAHANSQDEDGHGTHTTTSCIGRTGTVPGTASGSRVAFIDIESGGVIDLPGDNLSDMMIYAYNHGARIFSFSFGTDYCTYDSYAEELDLFVSHYPDMTVFVSAGNEGPATKTLSSLANSKNTIAVGSTRTTVAGFVRALDYYDPPVSAEEKNAAKIAYETQDGWSADTVSWFSSRGPTADNRQKPDIVGPGEGIVAAKKGGGLVAMQGTSMSTPQVAGVAALVREYLINEKGMGNPSAALMKCVLLLLTDDVSRACDNAYDSSSLVPATASAKGFGRLNYNLLNTMRLTLLPGGTLERVTDTARICYTVSSSVEVILSWTDPPPTMSGGRALVNDLDLTATYCGSSTRIASSFSRVDNVERISVDITGEKCVCFNVGVYSLPRVPQTYAWAAISSNQVDVTTEGDVELPEEEPTPGPQDFLESSGSSRIQMPWIWFLALLIAFNIIV